MKGHAPSIVAFLAAVVLAVLGSISPLWVGAAHALGVDPWLVGGLLIVGSLTALVVALPDARGEDGAERGDSSGEDPSRSLWSLLPSSQYDGVYADSGGLTRGEQESSLEEVNRRADEVAREHRRRR